MNRFVFLWCALIATLFLSCSKDNNPEQEEEKNPIIGTRWEAPESGQTVIWLEFGEERKVILGLTDRETTYEGKYSIEGNAITFTILAWQQMVRAGGLYYILTYDFKSAVINGDTMTVNVHYSSNVPNNPDSDFTQEFSRVK